MQGFRKEKKPLEKLNCRKSQEDSWAKQGRGRSGVVSLSKQWDLQEISIAFVDISQGKRKIIMVSLGVF